MSRTVLCCAMIENDLEGGNVGMTATRRASGGEAMQSGGGQVNSPWHAPLGLVSGIPFRGYPGSLLFALNLYFSYR